MSADNWTRCPRCAAERTAENAKALAEVKALYGKVPVEEFDHKRQVVVADVDRPLHETFREDYEFYGASTGTLHISYGGGCDQCGLQVEFNHELPFYPLPAAGGAE